MSNPVTTTFDYMCKQYGVTDLVNLLTKFAGYVKSSKRVEFTKTLKDGIDQIIMKINTGFTRVGLDLVTLIQKNPDDITSMMKFYEDAIIYSCVSPYYLNNELDPEHPNTYYQLLTMQPFNNGTFPQDDQGTTLLILINTVYQLRSVLNNMGEDFAAPINEDTAALWIAELLYSDTPSYERLSDNNNDFTSRLDALITTVSNTGKDDVEFMDIYNDSIGHPSNMTDAEIEAASNNKPKTVFNVGMKILDGPAVFPLQRNVGIPKSDRDRSTASALRVRDKDQYELLNNTMDARLPNDSKWTANLGTSTYDQTKAITRLYDNVLIANEMINDYFDRCKRTVGNNSRNNTGNNMDSSGGAKARKSKKSRKSKKANKSRKSSKSRKHNKRH
jgi:hypothetical protein